MKSLGFGVTAAVVCAAFAGTAVASPPEQTASTSISTHSAKKLLTRSIERRYKRVEALYYPLCKRSGNNVTCDVFFLAGRSQLAYCGTGAVTTPGGKSRVRLNTGLC